MKKAEFEGQKFVGQRKGESALKFRNKLIREHGLENASSLEKSRFLKKYRVKQKPTRKSQLENLESTARTIATRMVSGKDKRTHVVLKGNKAFGINDMHIFHNPKWHIAEYSTGQLEKYPNKEFHPDIKVGQIYKTSAGDIDSQEHKYGSLVALKELGANDGLMTNLSDHLPKLLKKNSSGRSKASSGRSSG